MPAGDGTGCGDAGRPGMGLGAGMPAREGRGAAAPRRGLVWSNGKRADWVRGPVPPPAADVEIRVFIVVSELIYYCVRVEILLCQS